MPMTSPFAEAMEVALTEPPIVRALVQLRFGPVLSLIEDSQVAQFQDHIRGEYPNFSKHQAMQLILGPDGVTQLGSGEQLFQFSSADGWVLTLAAGFLAIDTSVYTSRTDLVTRVASAVDALAAVVGASTPWQRLGARYVNRLEGPDFDRLEDLVRAPALGARGLGLAGEAALVHSLNEAQFDTGLETGLTVRWGILPANLSVTPDVPAAATPSWILDSDAFSLEGGILDSAQIAKRTADLCDATYRAFRWATTDELLRSKGGKL